VERVADGVRGRSFALRIDQIGYWPRPRILWCGSSGMPDALRDLVADLQTGLQACGFERERRPYAAHITLARKARPVAFQHLAQPIDWSLNDFALVGSRLGGDPPRYRVLRRWSLDPSVETVG
jgi:2'-5' RNA ligase